MTLIESIIYGIVQGLCEFLPISSSGHLALLHSILGQSEDPLAFDVLLHFGTLVAVFIVYCKDIWALIKAFFTLVGKIFTGKFKFSSLDLNERWIIFILIATLPLVIAVFVDDRLEALMAYPVFIGGCLIFNAFVLFFSDKIGKQTKGISELKPKNALVVGLCQLFALLPGISRSGSTITGGLSQDLNRESAVRFSFIMSIPAILGACALKLPDFFKEAGKDTEALGIYLVGALAAAITGIFAIGLVKFISKHSSFRVFSYYCAVIGAAAIVYGIVR